jgi:RNA polymerase sigma-54 factor
VDVLEETSLHVARRTVAKYRDLMGILPARMRRKF